MNPTYDYNYVTTTTTVETPSLDDIYEEMRSINYAFIKGPQELNGLKIEDPGTQKIILDWLEKERSKGNKLVSAFNTSVTWLFEVTPNSVRFITDEI
jgi:hypothetical protein